MLTPEQMRKTAFDESPYIRLQDGGSFTGICVECEKTKNVQDPTKSTYIYTFEINGKRKFFKTSSLVFLEKMADHMNKTINITRHGEGQETKYEIAYVAE